MTAGTQPPVVERSAAIHAVLFVAIYTIYAQHICPILSEREWWEVSAPAIVALGLHLAGRSLAERQLWRGSPTRYLRRGLLVDLAFFALSAVAVSALNRWGYGAPAENVAKVAVAFAAMGFYITLDLALDRERRLSGHLARTGGRFPQDGRALTFAQKFIIFSLANLVILVGVLVLVVAKDLAHVMRGGITATEHLLILTEVAFVAAVLGAYVVRVIAQYSRNMHLALDRERAALTGVVSGDLYAHAPVVSGDEMGAMADLTNTMIARLRATLVAMRETQDQTIRALVSLAAHRDQETGRHLERTALYVGILARTLRERTGRTDLDDAAIERMQRCAPLHDIGKVGIPDNILLKPGPLSESEMAVMRTHTTLGARALLEAGAKEHDETCFLRCAMKIAATHHERWDGTGYPNGLVGTAIPLAGRLMAVADVYDALRSARPYKAAMSHARAAAIIREGAGSHFDPQIVEAFVERSAQFEHVSSKLGDAVDVTALAA